MEVGGAVHRGGTGEYRQQWRVNGSGQGWTGIGGRAVRVKRGSEPTLSPAEMGRLDHVSGQ